MAQNELKNRTRFSTTLDIEVSKKLKEYSKKTSIPISKLSDKAFLLFFESTDTG